MNQDTYLSDRQLAERYAVHRATPWRWIKSRNFPRPVKLTEGCTRWRLSDVLAWEALTTLAGLHSKNINIDELHKNILDVEKAGR